MATCPWISGSFTLLAINFESSSKSLKYKFCSLPLFDANCCSSKRPVAYCKFSLPLSELKFVLHDALQSSGLDTTYARVREFSISLLCIYLLLRWEFWLELGLSSIYLGRLQIEWYSCLLNFLVSEEYIANRRRKCFEIDVGHIILLKILLFC